MITARTTDAVTTFLEPGYLNRVVRAAAAQAGHPITYPQAAVAVVSQRLRFSEAQQAGILSHFIRGGDLTAGGVMHAGTSAAQVQSDADVAHEMEAAGLRALEIAYADMLRPSAEWLLASPIRFPLGGEMPRVLDTAGFAALEERAVAAGIGFFGRRRAIEQVSVILAAKGGGVADITVGDCLEFIEIRDRLDGGKGAGFRVLVQPPGPHLRADLVQYHGHGRHCPRIPPRDVAKRRRGGIPHVSTGTQRSWPARAQQGSNIAKQHSRRPGKDAQEVRPSTPGPSRDHRHR